MSDKLRDEIVEILYIHGNGNKVSHNTMIAGGDVHILADSILNLPEMVQLREKAQRCDTWQREYDNSFTYTDKQLRELKEKAEKRDKLQEVKHE